MLKVAFCTPDWLNKPPGARPNTIGGAGYYRMQLPADMLNKHAAGDFHCQVFSGCWGHPETGELYPVLWPDRLLPGRLVCDETGWDVIVLQRWMAEKDAGLIRRARAAGQVVVQDVDDHFWAVHTANRAHRDVRRADWNADFYRANLAASDHITVSTQYLADHLGDLGVPVTVLPNMIDLTLWERQPVQDHLRTVGWCGHTGYRSADLETVGTAMRHFLRVHPDITFVHGGHDPASTHVADLLNIPKSRIVTRPTCPIQQWPRIWQGIDMAILPLNNVEFNLAKSPIKAMEASASGVPFIATHYGPYAHYDSGLRVRNNWHDALEFMLDKDNRALAADGAHQRVQREDANTRWASWAALYKTLTASQRTAAQPDPRTLTH